jgi:SAM-dependent methyltransferase
MPLPRAQLFELNDHDRAPAALRDTIVETLSRALRWGRMLEGLVPPLRRFLAEAGTTDVLDLCAGAGGPAAVLAEECARAGGDAPRLVLTDLYPHVEAWRELRDAHPGVIDFVAEPVDATKIPDALGAGRVRTVINAFHHFPPALATAILADAVATSRGVFVSEAFDRNPLQFLNFAPAALASLLAAPVLTHRDRAAKALYAWATPIALLAGTWDGIVSTLRVYREEDIRAMVAPFGGHWTWTFGTYDYPPAGRGVYFYGLPPA